MNLERRFEQIERALGLGRPDDGLCHCPSLMGNGLTCTPVPYMAVRNPSGAGVAFVRCEDWDNEADGGRGGIRPGATVYASEPRTPPAVCPDCGRDKKTIYIQWVSHDIWRGG